MAAVGGRGLVPIKDLHPYGKARIDPALLELHSDQQRRLLSVDERSSRGEVVMALREVCRQLGLQLFVRDCSVSRWRHDGYAYDVTSTLITIKKRGEVVISEHEIGHKLSFATTKSLVRHLLTKYCTRAPADWVDYFAHETSKGVTILLPEEYERNVSDVQGARFMLASVERVAGWLREAIRRERQDSTRRAFPVCAGIDTEGKPPTTIQISVGSLIAVWPLTSADPLLQSLVDESVEVAIFGDDDIGALQRQLWSGLKLNDIRTQLQQMGWLQAPTRHSVWDSEKGILQMLTRNSASLLEAVDAIVPSDKHFYVKPKNIHWMSTQDYLKDRSSGNGSIWCQPRNVDAEAIVYAAVDAYATARALRYIFKVHANSRRPADE